MTEITLQVRPEVARALQHRGQPSAESEELLKTAANLGVSLEPIHPGTEDPILISYFTAAVADPDSVEQVLDRLRQCRAVEAAYVKPPDALP
ncbi:MAG: hypothetical protein ACRD6N_07665 [Pyrinomonadaceae bacterium]